MVGTPIAPRSATPRSRVLRTPQDPVPAAGSSRPRRPTRRVALRRRDKLSISNQPDTGEPHTHRRRIHTQPLACAPGNAASRHRGFDSHPPGLPPRFLLPPNLRCFSLFRLPFFGHDASAPWPPAPAARFPPSATRRRPLRPYGPDEPRGPGEEGCSARARSGRQGGGGARGRGGGGGGRVAGAAGPGAGAGRRGRGAGGPCPPHRGRARGVSPSAPAPPRPFLPPRGFYFLYFFLIWRSFRRAGEEGCAAAGGSTGRDEAEVGPPARARGGGCRREEAGVAGRRAGEGAAAGADRAGAAAVQGPHRRAPPSAGSRSDPCAGLRQCQVDYYLHLCKGVNPLWLQEAKETLSVDKARLEDLQRLLRTRQQCMVGQVATLYPVKVFHDLPHHVENHHAATNGENPFTCMPLDS